METGISLQVPRWWKGENEVSVHSQGELLCCLESGMWCAQCKKANSKTVYIGTPFLPFFVVFYTCLLTDESRTGSLLKGRVLVQTLSSSERLQFPQ